MIDDLVKKQFLQLILASEALKFGRFTTKSGRQSPYFINFGCFDEGAVLTELARIYAQTLIDRFPQRDVFYLFGAAYKGIPLAVATCLSLFRDFQKKAYFTFNRKEVKKHGETGSLVGYAYQGGEEIVMIDDVLTGGVSAREALTLLKNSGVNPRFFLVGVDRQELGSHSKSARKELEEDFHLPVESVLTIREIIDMIKSNADISPKYFASQRDLDIALEEYFSRYCPLQ